MDFEADELDELLGEAMRSRPEATPRNGVDLAGMAMWRVRAGDARMAHLSQMGRRLRWCSLAAGLLVALVLAGGVYLYPATDNTGTTNVTNDSVADGTAQTNLESSSETSNTTTSSSIDWTTLGLAALGLAVVGVAVKGVMVPERQGLRFAGA